MYCKIILNNVFDFTKFYVFLQKNMSLSAVELILRNKEITRRFMVDVAEDDTILNLKLKLSAKSGLDVNLMKIIFCGRQLDEYLRVNSLDLGLQTFVNFVLKFKIKKNRLKNILLEI